MCAWAVIPSIINIIEEVNMDSGYKSIPTKNMHRECQRVFPFMPLQDWASVMDVNLGMMI